MGGSGYPKTNPGAYSPRRSQAISLRPQPNWSSHKRFVGLTQAGDWFELRRNRGGKCALRETQRRIPQDAPERARALSRRGTRTVVGLANDYAHTYAPFIRAAVREVGHNYRQVAKWLTREQIPAQRAGQWKAQSVKNLVVRYWGLTGRRILIPYKKFPTPAHRHRWA